MDVVLVLVRISCCSGRCEVRKDLGEAGLRGRHSDCGSSLRQLIYMVGGTQSCTAAAKRLFVQATELEYSIYTNRSKSGDRRRLGSGNALLVVVLRSKDVLRFRFGPKIAARDCSTVGLPSVVLQRYCALDYVQCILQCCFFSPVISDTFYSRDTFHSRAAVIPYRCPLHTHIVCSNTDEQHQLTASPSKPFTSFNHPTPDKLKSKSCPSSVSPLYQPSPKQVIRTCSLRTPAGRGVLGRSLPIVEVG